MTDCGLTSCWWRTEARSSCAKPTTAAQMLQSQLYTGLYTHTQSQLYTGLYTHTQFLQSQLCKHLFWLQLTGAKIGACKVKIQEVTFEKMCQG